MKLLPLAIAALLFPVAALRALDFTAQGPTITVSAGSAEVSGHAVRVNEATTLAIAPAPIQSVTDEPLKLSKDKPAGWAKGTRLHGCNARDVNASGSFIADSLEIRIAKGGDLLKEGEDYLVDPEWGHVGLGPHSRVTADDTVYASYRYSLRRMDTVQVGGNGKVSLKQGQPHISAPVPPAADPGCTAIAHVFIEHRAKEITRDDIYPITESAEQAVTASIPGRIPKTLAKLKAGQPVTIVCLGDSVTAGGNASTLERRYVDVFAAGLRGRFPQAKIDVQNISAGGSNSRQWLDPESIPIAICTVRRIPRVLIVSSKQSPI
jgi:hypothetical protein